MLFVAFASFVATALPVLTAPLLSDVHRTMVQLVPLDSTETALDASHFAVIVSREDQILDDQRHNAAVASRTTSVLLRFDVATDGSLSLNNVPIPLGVTRAQVEAKTSVTFAEGNDIDRIAASSAFDVGIVSVEVAAVGSEIRMSDGIVRRIQVLERIVELNGAAVAQHERIQQVIELLPGGTVRRSRPCRESEGSALSAALAIDAAGGASAMRGSSVGAGTGTSRRRSVLSVLGSWLRLQPLWMQLVLCITWSFAIAAAAFMLLRAIARAVALLRAQHLSELRSHSHPHLRSDPSLYPQSLTVSQLSYRRTRDIEKDPSSLPSSESSIPLLSQKKSVSLNKDSRMPQFQQQPDQLPPYESIASDLQPADACRQTTQ